MLKSGVPLRDLGKKAGKKAKTALNQAMGHVPSPLKENLYLRAFGTLQVPLLGWVGPQVVELTDERCVIKIPLGRRTKNHLNSLYFAVLAAGADIAGGFSAMREIEKSGHAVSLVFKDFQADFLKRADGDTFFTCTDGRAIRELVEKTIESGERQNLPVQVIATVPSKHGEQPVAQFKLTLSLKRASK